MDTNVETTRGWTSCVALSVPVRAELSWRASDHPGDLQLRVVGELCVWTVACIEPALGGLVSDRRPTTVTLDLSGVTFIDARGVSLLHGSPSTSPHGTAAWQSPNPVAW